jgi:hypothetical protein
MRTCLTEYSGWLGLIRRVSRSGPGAGGQPPRQLLPTRSPGPRRARAAAQAQWAQAAVTVVTGPGPGTGSRH